MTGFKKFAIAPHDLFSLFSFRLLFFPAREPGLEFGGERRAFEPELTGVDMVRTSPLIPGA